MDTRTLSVALEISLWHNGKPVTATGIVYLVNIHEKHESAVQLHAIRPTDYYQVRFLWRSEIIDDWVTAEAMLIDDRGAPLGGRRPTLIYLGPCDIPTTTTFLCDWADYTPSKAGIWVLATRAADSFYKLAEKIEAQQ